jgi:hypothetical protein
LSAVPSMPTATPAAAAAIGFTCAIGATLAEDLKESNSQPPQAPQGKA